MRTIGVARHWVAGIVEKLTNVGKRSAAKFAKRSKYKLSSREAGEVFDLAESTIPQVSSELEARFMATADILEKLNEDGREIVRATDHLVNIATGKGDGQKALEHAMKVVQGPLVLLSDCHVKSEDLYLRLQSYREGIVQLQTKEPELRRAMAPLRFMQALLKIESAPLNSEAQAMFNALSLEIERLQGQMYELFNTKFTELHQVQKILETVCIDLQRHTASLSEFINLEKARIQQSLSDIQNELAENRVREALISQLSRSVAKEIQKVVAALQIQDIVSQKLEHISSGLRKTGARFGSNSRDVSSLSQSFSVQSLQLNAVRQDLVSAQAEVRSGIENILDQILKADSNCISLKDLSKITTSADGTVQTLLDDIKGVTEQVASVVSGSSRVHDALKPVSGLASGVTSVVKELSLSIHLIGLNAQVQAAQFSQGAGLGVISYRMSEISGVTSQLSKSIATDLDFVSNGLNESILSFKDLNEKALTHQKLLDTEGRNSELGLHMLRDDAMLCVQKIGKLVDRISFTSQTCLDTIDYVEIADSPLGHLQEVLEKIASSAQPEEVVSDGDLKGIVKDFHSDYTMESERIIFAQATARKNLKPGLIPSGEPKDTLPQVTPKDDEGASPELKTEETLVCTASPAKSEFGDNVDLF